MPSAPKQSGAIKRNVKAVSRLGCRLLGENEKTMVNFTRPRTLLLFIFMLQSLPPLSHGGITLPPASISIATTDGKKFTDCKIIRVEPDGIVISHAIGVTKVPFSDLPSNLRQQYEVPLPWYIRPEVAAHYWPSTIEEVLSTIAPEIALSKAALDNVISSNAHDIAAIKLKFEGLLSDDASMLSDAKLLYENAMKELASPTEYNTSYWYKLVSSDYAYLNNKLIRVGADITHLHGKVLSVPDKTHVIISTGGDVVACQLANTNGFFAEVPFNSLGRLSGTYKYKGSKKSAKQIKCYDPIPYITLEEFKKNGEDAFPEVETAKRKSQAALVQNERVTREALRKAENAAQTTKQAASESLAKAESVAAEAEQVARESLRNAGRLTYERMLGVKIQAEDNQIRQRTAIAAQRAQEAERYDQEQEARNRQIKSIQDAENRRAREVQQERFRIKGADDFH